MSIAVFRLLQNVHETLQSFVIVKYAKERGIGPIQMASNGLLLDERAQDGLIEAGGDYLSFSLDTVDPEAYRVNTFLQGFRPSSPPSLSRACRLTSRPFSSCCSYTRTTST